MEAKRKPGPQKAPEQNTAFVGVSPEFTNHFSVCNQAQLLSRAQLLSLVQISHSVPLLVCPVCPWLGPSTHRWVLSW